MLFEDRTNGHFAARYRRPKKGNSAGALEDSSSSSPSGSLSMSSSSEWENADSNAEQVALPSLPARPSFPVDVVAHAPKNLTSLAELAQCYDSQVLSPLSCLDDDIEMEDVYLNNYGLENGICWPKLPAEDEGPADFAHLLEPVPVQQPLSPVSSVCPTTLMDEREGQSDMLEGLGQFLDDTDRALGEMISYCDTLVQMDPSPAEA